MTTEDKKTKLSTEKQSVLDRRQFVAKVGGVALAGAGLAACGSEQGSGQSSGAAVVKKVQELKMVTSWPKNFPGLGTAARRFGERLEAASGGRFKVTLYGGGELVHPLKCHDALQEGTADLYHSADYYYKGKSLAYAFFTAVPFGFRPDEMDAWLHHGGGQELWDEVGAQFGIKHLACSNTGCQMGGWFRKPIRRISDIRGLKMRIPGMGGDVINELGGSAVTLGGAEIMPALTSGNIDASEWVGPWNDLAFGFYKAAKYYHWPGFHEPGSTLSCGVRKSLWDGLSADDKALFEHCALAENNYGLAEFNARNGEALQTLLNDHGVKLVEFPNSVYREFGRASRDVLSNAGTSGDAITRRVYDSFIKFRKDQVGWSRLSDQGYMNKRDVFPF